VKNGSLPKPDKKKDWQLNANAFRQLLLWLDEGGDSGGEVYLEMRRRLVSYFDRKNCLPVEELADETLNRVARRLEEEGAITDTTPAHYCYIVAKFVFLEYLRQTEHRQISFDELPNSAQQTAIPAVLPEQVEETAIEEKRLLCFEGCLQNLEADNRELIIQYYYGEQRVKIDNRRAMAKRLQITMNALTIRACRLRDQLETCVNNCLGREE